jgi:hypothetical protein
MGKPINDLSYRDLIGIATDRYRNHLGKTRPEVIEYVTTWLKSREAEDWVQEQIVKFADELCSHLPEGEDRDVFRSNILAFAAEDSKQMGCVRSLFISDPHGPIAQHDTFFLYLLSKWKLLHLKRYFPGKRIWNCDLGYPPLELDISTIKENDNHG